jgi:hypothetical protein
MLRRALPLPLRMRPRVQRAPGIPCALRFLEGQRMQRLGRKVSRECEVMCHCRRRVMRKLALTLSFRGALEQHLRRHSGAALRAEPIATSAVIPGRASWRGPGIHNHHYRCGAKLGRQYHSQRTTVVMDSGLDASHRPGMTNGKLRAHVDQESPPTTVIPGLRSSNKTSAVIPGRRFAPSPESITTKLRLGHDAAPVMFNINIGGYGFRARAPRAPE